MMMRRLLVRATVLLSLAGAVLPGVAGGAPTPMYDVTCVVGGSTTGSWQRAKLVGVTFEWFASGSTTFQDVTAPVSPRPPRGSVVTGTPASGGVDPVTVTVLFERADGSIDQTTVGCT